MMAPVNYNQLFRCFAELEISGASLPEKQAGVASRRS